MSEIGLICAAIAAINIVIFVYITIINPGSTAYYNRSCTTSEQHDDLLRETAWSRLMAKKLAGEDVERAMDMHLYGKNHPEDRQ